MTPQNELHVIFGTGPVGRSVARELVAQGKSVRAVNRSGQANLPSSVQVSKGDASDPAQTRQLAQGATHLYFCVNPPYTEWAKHFPPMQSAVIAAAEASAAKLIVMENVYAYGDPDGKPITEDMPYQAHTRKGQIRAKMSQDLMAAHQAGRIRAVIGRASDFFGPEVLESSMGERVIYPALEGKAAQVIGNMAMPHSHSYMPDIGKALVILGQREESLGQAWHIPSLPAIPMRQMIEMIYAEAGHPPQIQAMPKLMLKTLRYFVPILREVDEMLYEFEKPFVLDHSKFARAFGDHSTPLQQAVQATVAWYKANPKKQ
jgi:nucleoside-diphosphate-sugar epimerase